MRGEKFAGRNNYPPITGSPPHARGKAFEHTCDNIVDRITPACAGKSYYDKERGLSLQDHPRMRGEKVCETSELCERLGSPPHARGKESLFA